MEIDGIHCVVVRADVFEQVRGVLSPNLTHDDLRAMIARSFGAGP